MFSKVKSRQATPDNWNQVKLKRWVAINGDTLGDATDPDLRFDYVDIGAVGQGRLVSPLEVLQFAAAPSRARRSLAPGDTIVSTVRTYLKATNHFRSLSRPTVASTGFAVLTPLAGTDPAFVGYAVQGQRFLDAMTADSVGIAYPAISESKLGNIVVSVPPADEQAAIVKYLGHAHARIDRAIAAKRKLIALLEEQKQAIIHQAVTRGLDPTVPLKDSGIPWLGEIPAHWKLSRLGNVLAERGEVNRDGQVDHVLSLLRTRGVIPYDEKGNIGNKKSEDITRYKIVRPGDIVLNSMNVIIGSVDMSAYTGCLSPVYYVLMPRGGNSGEYLNAIFQVPMFHRGLVRFGNGIMAHRMRIPMELLKLVEMPQPPEDEQLAISAHIKGALARSEDVARRALREIELLREFRTRLTSDVVTGQVDVREIAATLPELTDYMLASGSGDTVDTDLEDVDDFTEGEDD